MNVALYSTPRFGALKHTIQSEEQRNSSSGDDVAQPPSSPSNNSSHQHEDAQDLLSFGTHCDVKDCRQLDFLPFRCDSCTQTFCLDHRTYESHKCSAAPNQDIRIPECPKCQQKIQRPRGSDAAAQIQKHIASGCRDLVLLAPRRKCNHKGCKNTEALSFKCNRCEHQFCIKHMRVQDHTCSSQSIPPSGSDAHRLAKPGQSALKRAITAY
ncbi:hypothetical protein CAOG_06345 [Capsaspora owczarzaki ATCC 30864]|uniref:AN1-type domain-containing protein n=1 Tax=Capsaspora owczarzaki (strain ATCC 30864) TaxID=595528 RepID=A0A0D2VWK4_CAPO3|nr:hypothetical protein CAOG_06345 [Capsaspora owczarzaki ATCC 30864]KJE95962.1 hypothetical protein CAOG_006345 [Capsaspora owczarzaki ATCC 30864]|eukprot:XP_004345094.1 hypothetical protein CAOG_06345 [Capsaspora owczarzaki ATCC 30864]